MQISGIETMEEFYDSCMQSFNMIVTTDIALRN